MPGSLKETHDRPEALNLLSIFAALNNRSTEEIISFYSGKEFSLFKNDLADVVVEKMDPINKEMKKLMEDKTYLDLIMKNGKEKAIYVADSVLDKVYSAVGFSKT